MGHPGGASRWAMILSSARRNFRSFTGAAHVSLRRIASQSPKSRPRAFQIVERCRAARLQLPRLRISFIEFSPERAGENLLLRPAGRHHLQTNPTLGNYGFLKKIPAGFRRSRPAKKMWHIVFVSQAGESWKIWVPTAPTGAGGGNQGLKQSFHCRANEPLGSDLSVAMTTLSFPGFGDSDRPKYVTYDIYVEVCKIRF